MLLWEMPYVVHITPFSSHWAKLLTLWDFTHSETALPYGKFVEFVLNELPVLPPLKPHLSFYHCWWKFTNLLQKRALEGSQIQLCAFFFLRMTPVAPQLTEFGLLTETSDDWKLSQGRQPSQLQHCLKCFHRSLWGQMAKTKFCFCKTWSSTILHESLP